MQNIIVDKVNDVYIRIDADQSISRELSDYFSFEMPVYKFTPQFRRRVEWVTRSIFSYANSNQMYVSIVSLSKRLIVIRNPYI